ncbi:MAG: hypothetical protein GWO00_05425 [Gemmatimonadetes bacterium]|nr:hypothetical protein [Gemmatimonadota bacterium]NIR77834.1 hypothetical protein [Gemmatimonadota bacterium]NIT86370.1 hypothetical protein [Gemmatimonadota bacterium]NIU30207.1 hypothetical protein [Gemmatimonadota bacterium]NIV60602.1 hypothetical protein [Gemmatimonadota bacterium]
MSPDRAPPPGFTEDEERGLVSRIAAGEERPPCPRCGRELVRREVPPRAEVSYVRDRIWLVCAPCGRSAVLDRREVERAGRGGSDGDDGRDPPR